MSDFQTKINIAIIIPTLNEERFVGRLLDSINGQTVTPAELVVVDAYSKDRTIAEIKKRQKDMPNLRYFQIPKHTVARQRNFGVKKTISPHLLFLDADMELQEEDALGKYFNEVLKKEPDVAAAKNLPDSNFWKDSVYFRAEDLLFRVSKYFWPVVTARNLYVNRQIFDQVRGFDESITVGEDSELVYRIVKRGGKLIFLKDIKLHTSVRRVSQEGRRKYALKMIRFGFNMMLRGRKKSTVKYEFGNF
ncbi:glycosyltransferase [Candidatus Daviesbacteria bacterium]|nr:glycosyltransferase [Candidatus Daviesbacteria bacterium]